jgi:hypothetical protein
MPAHFLSSWLLLCLIAFNAHSQHLFGNPSCSDWQQQPAAEKTTWLNAYLVPLNMTNVARKNPRLTSSVNSTRWTPWFFTSTNFAWQTLMPLHL